MKLKKVMLLSTLPLMALLLSACGDEEGEISEVVMKSVKYFEEKKYEESIDYLLVGIKEEPKNALYQEQYAIVKEEYANALLKKIKELEGTETKTMEERAKLYEKAFELNPLIEEDLAEQTAKIKETAAVSRALDDYSEWLSNNLTRINDTVKFYRNIESELASSSMDLNTFLLELNNLKNTNKEIVEDAEKQLLVTTAGLTEIHQEYLVKLRANHEAMNRMIITINEGNIDVTNILDLGKDIPNTTYDYTTLVEKARALASEYGIAFYENY